MDKNNLGIKVNWRSRKSIIVYLLMVYFLFTIVVFYHQDTGDGVQKLRIDGILLLWALLFLLALTEIEAIRRLFKKQAKWLNGTLLVLMPAISFLMVETMVSNINREMFKNYSLYNVIWYIMIYYTIYVLIRNTRYTLLIGNLLVYLAAMLNYLVYLFRGNPIIPSDLLAWQTGMSVASNYDLSFSRDFLIATLIMIAVFVLGLKLENSNKRITIGNRCAGLALYALFLYVVLGAFFHTDLIKTKIRVIDFFAPKYTYSSYGTAFGFVANVQAMETERPEGYDIDVVRQEFEKEAANSEESTVSQTKPNIIAIMNEAFSDLSMIGKYPTDKEYLPYTRKLEENTTKGMLYVSVFGGATSDTEYEFLTGNSMKVMPQNCVPYQQFVTEPTDSLASVLKQQGYYNIAIHPYKPSGYKRDLVYPLLGFDEFLSEEDFTEPQRIRSYISDMESYQKIIEQYENKGKDQPLFIFNVTMQNHGGYSGEQVFKDEETVRLKELSGYKKVEQYLSLLRESDKAFETLIDYFSKEKEPTIIVLFGDHQPVVFSEFHDAIADLIGETDLEVYRKKYAVPVLLWANYDISEDDLDQISANYLSSYLLKTAGLQMTPYNEYLMKLYREVPVVTALFYIDKEGVFHKYGKPSGYSDLITEYQYVGYNNALDKKGRLDSFYTLGDDKKKE